MKSYILGNIFGNQRKSKYNLSCLPKGLDTLCKTLNLITFCNNSGFYLIESDRIKYFSHMYFRTFFYWAILHENI